MSHHTPSDAATMPPSNAPIGAASMASDGTVYLQLRAEGSNGEVGDAMFTYKPGEPRYQQIIEHVGGLKPGESKPMPPWPKKP